MFKSKKYWILGLLFLVVVLYYFFLDPYQQTNFFLSCPFYNVTGYQCPGCGSQRAFHEILHLHFLKAFKQNMLFVLAIPYILAAIFFNVKKDKYPKTNEFLLGKRTLLVLLLIAILFGVFRNL